MAIAYRVVAPLVLAKGKDGRIHHYYHPDSQCGPALIPWLSDEQATKFLDEGLVEKVEVADPVKDAAGELRVAQCISALTSLKLPADCGAPTARDALREHGAMFSNEVIAAAVKVRKATLSGTVGEPQ